MDKAKKFVEENVFLMDNRYGVDAVIYDDDVKVNEVQ